MSISTHVLDSTTGTPASGVATRLELASAAGWQHVADAVTDTDGRVGRLAETAESGTYRLTFDVGSYFDARGIATFYPEVTISFRVDDPGSHYHVPLLLSPFAYSTYRGS
ncbi:5-hydroxyisourate hydrolase [Haloechinothrix alba]|uniref:5-hydroxyisourate hydrolase n=1 Tax=Haloechinothrix alba TaxID=664784 RepID=A0A238Y236_9PSEU|nr:hydroxyisourate hydrolase [Haloechinothrix alba]SNR64359.1 5-hydroxyisourate hydrolase [Haloechinothrix alba]